MTQMKATHRRLDRIEAAVPPPAPQPKPVDVSRLTTEDWADLRAICDRWQQVEGPRFWTRRLRFAALSATDIERLREIRRKLSPPESP